MSALKVVPFLAALVANFAGQAVAQHSPSPASSIEWMAAASAVVVQGKVTAVAPFKTEEANTVKVTIQTGQVLKGDKRGEIEFVCCPDDPVSKRLREWQKEGTTILAFLRGPNDSERTTPVLGKSLQPLFYIGYGSVIELSSTPEPKAVTTSLELLADAQNILSKTRQAIKDAAKLKTTRSITLHPATPLCKLPWVLVDLQFTVPLDDRLEKIAQAWTKSPKPELQALGKQALKAFQTDANPKENPPRS